MFQLLKLRNLALALLILLCFYFFLSFSVEASALPRPATGVMAQPTVPTPPPLIQLTIDNDSGNAALSWTDAFTSDVHYVYRSTEPFFIVSTEDLIATIPAGVTTYVDTNSGIGNINTNHFYKVTAWVGLNGVFSNYVGEIDYPLQNSTGAYSLIGVPFLDPSPSDAAELAAKISNVGNVYRWDANTLSFQVFSPPNIDNFNLSYGDAIFIQTGNGAAASINLAGEADRKLVTLYPNNYSFVTMPLHCGALTDAAATAADITNVINLLQWDQSFQSFQIFTPPNIGDNFALQIGDPLIVQLGASGPPTWPDDLPTLCQ